MKIDFKARQQARRHLMQAIYQWIISEQSLSEIENQFLLAFDGKRIDTDYFVEGLHNILTQLDQIDSHFKPFTTIAFEKIDAIELAILRLATYELQHKLEIPYKVVINEALELTKTFGSVEGFKFVNGVLDKTARQLRKTEFDMN